MGLQGIELQQGGTGVRDAGTLSTMLQVLQKNALTPDIKTLLAEQRNSIKAMVSQQAYMTQYQLAAANPMQRAMQAQANPMMTVMPGATWLPEGQNLSDRGVSAGAAGQANQWLTLGRTEQAKYNAMITADTQRLRDNIRFGWGGGGGKGILGGSPIPGAPTKETLESTFSNIDRWGKQIVGINIAQGLKQSAYELANFSNSMRIAARTVSDWKGMLGMAGGSKYGRLSEQSWQAGYSSEGLGLAMTALDISRQKAQLNFGLSGSSPQERYAEWASKSQIIALQEKQLGYATTQHDIGGQLHQMDKTRGLTDSSAQVSLLQQQWDVTQSGKAAADAIAVLQKQLDAANTTVQTWAQNSTSMETNIVNATSSIVATTGKGFDEILSQTQVAWNGYINEIKAGLKNLGVDIPDNTGGFSNQNPRGEHAGAAPEGSGGSVQGGGLKKNSYRVPQGAGSDPYSSGKGKSGKTPGVPTISDSVRPTQTTNNITNTNSFSIVMNVSGVPVDIIKEINENFSSNGKWMRAITTNVETSISRSLRGLGMRTPS
jgi:hypothetical protein